MGAGAVTTAAGVCGEWGHRDGAADGALFSGPVSMALTTNKETGATIIYVADSANDAIRSVTLPSTGSGHAVVETLMAEVGGDNALSMPQGLVLVSAWGQEELFVTSYLYGKVLRYSGLSGAHAANLELIAGSGGYGFNDGVGKNATFMGAKGLAFSPARNKLLVADFFNMRIRGIQAVNGSSGVVGMANAHVHAPTHAPGAASSLLAATRPTTVNTWTEENLTAILQAQVTARAAAATRGAPAGRTGAVGPASGVGPVSPVRVMLWTGHSGPYHDHFTNGKVISEHVFVLSLFFFSRVVSFSSYFRWIDDIALRVRLRGCEGAHWIPDASYL
jgi:hypothetical protein